MFRQFARLPLRRCLHSQAGPSSRPFTRYTSSAYALGASAVVGYVAWSWGRDKVHLEAVPVAQKQSARPGRASVPTTSDAPTPSTPPRDAPESAAISISDGGSSPSLEPLEAEPLETEGEGAQEVSSGGAYNPETGEINWDCPCLGGMAHGPCGQQFRDAFSCFVHSDADPKGIDCVEKFKAMQDCFREHPDVYADEIMDEDEEEPPAGSVTTEKTEGDLHLSDSPSAVTTEQSLTPALS